MRKFLVRLDDACPRMNERKWRKFEELFDTFNIKPIIAVIPNNKHTTLMPNKYDNDFWHKVKHWQRKDWEIALHGYDHIYKTKGIGIIPKNNFSEFVGLDIMEQSRKIKKGIAIFKNHGIKTRTWIAPGHSFDKNTLIALKTNSDISIISDGYAFKPYYKGQFTWIPAQIQECKKVGFNGIWTFCFHPNETTDADFETCLLYTSPSPRD